ncbi:cation:proton antiporter [Mesoaciditoga sp.]
MINVDVLSYTLAIVMFLGMISYLFGERMHISYIPILIVVGMIFGPILGTINREMAHYIFDYVRVFGLVIILFTEGHDLKWPLLKKHMATIGMLDTVGLLITAVIAAFAFSWLFHVPFIVGFLFGAIISATDPATLIPLFKQHKVNEDIKTVIVTESIFNDPLGIVLTTLAIAFLLPNAQSARFLESFAKFTGLYPAAVLFFLYEVGVSIAIGIGLGILGYWLIRWLKLERTPVIYALSLAFGGFFIGEYFQASGYLVATTIGIVLGNHKIFFKRFGESKSVQQALDFEVKFNEILSNLSTVFIFLLLGASLDLKIIGANLVLGLIIAGVVIFVARPLAGTTLLPLKKWSWREYLFISFEGPRGVVPAALASLPLSLGRLYHNSQLVSWGETILSVTVIVVLTAVIVETLWVGPFKKKLLKD